MQSLANLVARPARLVWPDSPVPIALVITDLDVGGAERALVNLATRLDRERWRPTVICLDKASDLNKPLANAGIEVINLNVDRRKPIQAVFRLASAFRKLHPRLIQSFLFHANLASKLAAPFAGGPPVLCGIRVAEQEKRWHLRLDRLTSTMAVGSICVSEGVRKFTETLGGISPRRLTVIPNGIDVSTYDSTIGFDRRQLSINDDAIVGLFVGRLTKQKDVPTLLKAAEIVAAENDRFQLVIVGDGQDRAKLQSASGRNVHWLGRRDDVPALLKMSDFLVLPSLWEGMPNVVLEAMASGKAMVATNVEGSNELVIPGQTGWLVPPGSVEELTKALNEAVADRERLQQMGAAGRDRVEQHYDLPRVISTYEQIWTQILA